MWGSVPDSRPGFIGPTEAEWKIGLAGFQDFVKRPLEQTFPGKPIVVIAEALDSGVAGQCRLRGPRLGHAQIVKAKVGRDVRLVVAREKRFRLGHIRPLSKASAPPRVGFWNWMKLRKVEGYQPGFGSGRGDGRLVLKIHSPTEGRWALQTAERGVRASSDVRRAHATCWQPKRFGNRPARECSNDLRRAGLILRHGKRL